MTYDNGGDTVMATASGQKAREQLAGLLEEFVNAVPGVTHALLVSRDGLKLVDSGIPKTPADKWAATFGTLASLCENIPGPHGGKGGLQMAVVEREDALIFVTIAGTSAVFPNQPGNTAGVVDTVLAVIAEPSANPKTVGYEMGELVDRFAPYMVAAVRSA
ncbi:roadblock/LC7 domain-containing protein [Streptomyces sp. GbtcB6]|uniref:roadblock/LC7 domain-containing protein n=1 Tax=Streptomyces sp. GbtcB6 TaxID=2824751 RepID=UPI001C304C46|nr:roadblock/LC7 domain-containing protein [Streptomyces sp. GbtcB6]